MFLQILTFNFSNRHTCIRGITSEEVIDLLSIRFELFPFYERPWAGDTCVQRNTQFSFNDMDLFLISNKEVLTRGEQPVRLKFTLIVVLCS